MERSGGLTILAPHARRRARAPHPAQPAQGRRPTIRRPPFAAAYALLVALALLALALIDNAGRLGASDTGTLFWLPLLAMLLPGAFRLCSTDASSAERVALLVLLGAGLYLAKVLLSPAEFTFSDELSTLRTTKDLATTGGLLTPNTLARGFALYPGVDLSTLSLAHASALPLFTSGLLVIGAAKLVLVLAVFGLLLHASRSERVASIAALVYIANPNFLFFDAQFSYESLALAARARNARARRAGARFARHEGARRAHGARRPRRPGRSTHPPHHLLCAASRCSHCGHPPSPSAAGASARDLPAWPAAAVLLTTSVAVGRMADGRRQLDGRLPPSCDHRRGRIDVRLPHGLGHRQDPVPLWRRGQLPPRAGAGARLGADPALPARARALAPAQTASRERARAGCSWRWPLSTPPRSRCA